MEFKLGEVRERTGLTARQIRDWERHGLVAPRRGVGNQRVYGEDELARLKRAKRMRDAGLSLAQIKLGLAILEGSRLGADVEGLRQLQEIFGRMHGQLAIAEELAEAIRIRLSRPKAAGRP